MGDRNGGIRVKQGGWCRSGNGEKWSNVVCVPEGGVERTW